MLERIIPYETSLFYLINSTHNPFLDNVMWLYTGYKIWIPVYLFFIFLLVYKKDRGEWLPVLLSILGVFILCTLFSSGITKPFFARHRPTHFPSVMEFVRTLNDYTGEGIYGFISGHSINSFGFATFTALLFRQRIYTIVICIWALIMVYSRLYLGVHFISDIVAGTLAGILIGYLVYRIYFFYIQKKYPTDEKHIRPLYSAQRINILVLTIGGYIILFSLFSSVLVRFLG